VPRQNNNDLNMRYVNVDPGSGRFNSSSATLSIPSDARVLHAYLYWGADLAPGVNNPDADAAPGGRNPNTNELWKRVRLRVDGGAYTPIDAEDPLRNGQWAGVASWYSSVGNWPGYAYQVRADVTNEVRAGVQTTRRRGRAGAKLTAITVANVRPARASTDTRVGRCSSPGRARRRRGGTCRSSTASTSSRFRAASSSSSGR
jgi:hypothetical protein